MKLKRLRGLVLALALVLAVSLVFVGCDEVFDSFSPSPSEKITQDGAPTQSNKQTENNKAPNVDVGEQRAAEKALGVPKYSGLSRKSLKAFHLWEQGSPTLPLWLQ